MSKKFKVICEREVYDIANKEIVPGNVVAVSRFNSAPLEVYLVTSITYKSLLFGGIKYDTVFDSANQKWISKKYPHPSCNKKILQSGSIQNEIVRIDNPVFLIGNHYMEAVMQAVDCLTSIGAFPSDYTLGSPVPFQTTK